MILNNIDTTKPIRLIINKVEMDFSNSFSFYEHPINFSTMTFNEVIPKENNKYPDYLNITKYTDDFSLAEVYSGDKLIFFGVVNSTGRLDLFRTKPKTKTVEISDFRKWLSLKKPVEKYFFNKSPEDIVIAIVQGMNEPRIKIGTLSFSNNDNIKAYSSESKTPYQVLKELVAAQTNSLLYFKVEDDATISINYKSNDDIINDTSNIVLDLDNVDLLKDYKITEITLESNTDNYTNFVKFDSENIVSNVNTIESFELEDDDTITLLNPIGAIDNNFKNTYILKSDGTKVKLVVITDDLAQKGKYYDISYKVGSAEITMNAKWLNAGNQLFFSYFQKKRTALELKNDDQIALISSLSNTTGEVFQYEKYNDISSYNDLLKQAKNTLDYNSSLKKVLTITADKPIWEVADAVQVKCQDSNVAGIYLVQQMEGSVTASAIGDKTNFWLAEYTYTLQNTNNVDTYVNQFDNQSYRDNAITDDDSFIVTTESITINGNIIFSYEISTEDKVLNNNQLEQPLKMQLKSSIYENEFVGKYIYVNNN